MIAPALRSVPGPRTVEGIVATTRAIQIFIDEQIERGRTDEEIAAALPVAIAFITGRLTFADLLAIGRSR